MAKLWKKATFPTIEDLAKEVGIKKSLTLALRNSVRNLIGEQVGKEDVIESGDSVTNLCTALEAIFIHGLKGKFAARMASVFGANSEVNIPEPNFWPVVLSCSHKNVLSCISSMKQITTDVGRCRAWLRIAINDGLICSYLDTMISDKSVLQNSYTPVAYLRDNEQPDILMQVLTGISIFIFKLPCNTMSLNIWNSTPLVLAGVWTPPVMPQPVMLAADVMEYFVEQDKHKHEKSVKREVEVESSATDNEKTYDGFQVAVVLTPKLAHQEKKFANATKSTVKTNMSDSSDTSLDVGEVFSTSEIEALAGEKDNDTSDGSSATSMPDFKSDVDGSNIVPASDRTYGNKLFVESGWSSKFEVTKVDKTNEEQDQESYDSLLQSYNRNRPVTEAIVGTPDLSEMMFRNTPTSEETNDVESNSVESKSSISDYEVIPRTYLLTSSTSDDRIQHLLSSIGTIAQERGLDSQDYKCRGCGCPIGMLYGKAYICSYDGYSYCSGCHVNEEYFIPARIIHNWDFKKYPVAKYTKTFLTEVENEPLLNLKIVNPLIYTAVEEMAQMQSLRTQLTFLRSYIFTCKESIIEELRKKIWPREYLYEHVHLYSLGDLLQCSAKTLQQTLQKIIAFAKKHVLNCQLCSLKAFICEICNNSKVLYPFDIDIAYHCDQCLAVYHRNCIEAKKFCPKCDRKRKRLEMANSLE